MTLFLERKKPVLAYFAKIMSNSFLQIQPKDLQTWRNIFCHKSLAGIWRQVFVTFISTCSNKCIFWIWSLDCSILRFGWGWSLHFLRFYLRILSIRHRSDHRTWTGPHSSCWGCLCRDFWGTVVWGPRGRFDGGGPWGSGRPLKSTLCISVSWVLYSLFHYIL